MKKLFKLLVFTLLLAACSPKYFMQGTVSNNFDKSKTYNVAIMPPVIKGVGETANLQDKCYGKLKAELMNVKNLNIKGDLTSIKKAIKNNQIGASDYVDHDLYKKAAESVGCEAYVFTEITRESDKLPVLAQVEIFDVQSGNTLYVGRGRGQNPLTVEAEAELAIELALKSLLEK